MEDKYACKVFILLICLLLCKAASLDITLDNYRVQIDDDEKLATLKIVYANSQYHDSLDDPITVFESDEG